MTVDLLDELGRQQCPINLTNASLERHSLSSTREYRCHAALLRYSRLRILPLQYLHMESTDLATRLGGLN